MNHWWRGARWWKFDFHAHTPASDDYGKGPDQKRLRERTPKQWLLDYVQAGVDCVAVVDHNSGEWIDKLKASASNMQMQDGNPPMIFPGVEISVHGGIHVLALFGPDASTSEITRLLGAVGYQGKFGYSDACSEAPFHEVIKEISKAGGIAIPAHADDDCGLFNVERGPTLDQALSCQEITAVELRDAAYQPPELYRQRKLHWTSVLGSDAHHPDESHSPRHPGSHYTWVKMDAPHLDGLRLALLDGELSILRSDMQIADPNLVPDLILEEIEVRNAYYMGRSIPFSMRLNPWLNAIIGGRGTGKSSTLEFARLALRRDDELPKSLAAEYEKYKNPSTSRSGTGLLTPDTAISVIYRKDRSRFRIQWKEDASLPSIEIEEASTGWKPDTGSIKERFPVRIYSQKQIFELAKDPMALLRIVDEASEVGHSTWAERWREEETRFLSLRAKAREIEVGLADVPRLSGELSDLKRKLAVFEEAGQAEVLKEYQKRVRQQREVENWNKEWTESIGRIRTLAEELVLPGIDKSIFDLQRPEDAGLLARVGEEAREMDVVRDRLLGMAQDLLDRTVRWQKEADASDWHRAVESALLGYAKLRERLAHEGAGDPSSYGELVQRRQAIEERLRSLESRKVQLDNLANDAGSSLDRLAAFRREITQLRARFLAATLKDNPYVRINVMPYGARDSFEAELREILAREPGKADKDFSNMLDTLYGDPADPPEIESRLVALKKKLREVSTGKASPGELRDQRFAAHLSKLPPEAFDRLDLLFPEDSLQVEYSMQPDGSRFRSIGEGSPGQKTAALLAFLLSYGKEPIVLDQPEDDLDNHLIYGLIVTQLRRIKQTRQVIVVTHNANIVVNGDAELVVALAVGSGETREECAGSLQERSVRETICAIMEGGREAFEQRYRRIALGEPDVRQSR